MQEQIIADKGNFGSQEYLISGAVVQLIPQKFAQFVKRIGCVFGFGFYDLGSVIKCRIQKSRLNTVFDFINAVFQLFIFQIFYFGMVFYHLTEQNPDRRTCHANGIKHHIGQTV